MAENDWGPLKFNPSPSTPLTVFGPIFGSTQPVEGQLMEGSNSEFVANRMAKWGGQNTIRRPPFIEGESEEHGWKKSQLGVAFMFLKLYYGKLAKKDMQLFI